MSAGNEIIDQQHCLRLMAALGADPEPLDFATLKAISGATDGNLGAHLQTLERAGNVAVTKQAVGRRSRTWFALTAAGRRACAEHVTFLKQILDPGPDQQDPDQQDPDQQQGS